jgi:hypothetical protein
MSKLITTSFLDAVEWCKKAPDSICSDNPNKTWKQKAYDDIKNTLGRGEWVTTKATARGISFEAQIYHILNSNSEDTVKCSDNFRKVLQACKGGVFQKKTKAIVELDGEEYFLYGKIDAWFHDHIIDIKTTGKYSGKDKYLGSAQHLIYCYSENIKDFEYIIAEFNGEDSNIIKHIYNVPYHMNDSKEVEEEIKNRIFSAMAWLDNFPEPGDLKDLYMHKYNRF